MPGDDVVLDGPQRMLGFVVTQSMEVCGAVQHPLFGGALSAALPPSFQDVSNLREIPDNQEVFIHRSTDQSIIVELLEYQEGMSDPEAARYHFEDVAASNDARGRADIVSVEPLPLAQLSLTSCSSAWALTGHQLVAKFNEQAQNTVTIYMALFRIPQHSTDLLVTFNDPVAIDPASSSAVSEASQNPSPPWTQEDFNHLLCSFQLHDPGIFG
ncbi:ran guanine nucleotide release factor [Pseudophryne corroboree]|uniref:ran guanine nucleotide release factor n=1 Tax=Pseudophryne corroboree TaxID=495146 RepID=UPI00308144FF